ncbi:MAG TPA: 6-oxocyclohex-1-ene-1-carbonyl-CoA hydratase [Elusimicrobia bacterium]|nr:MAG: 6-oxocyclohex-1-ene-1-carbonyl-CoA hydrolase [Elusimicrobia bacterium GWA2_66_18]HAZ09360.1 6-oxocyclohex-1-ene-1-carbonyl-CoA hydratase [Elusimicrobiota bacterium]
MTLDWMPRDNELKDHGVGGDAYWGTLETPPCAVYEKKPLRGPDGREIPDLHVAWVTLNNPKQFNSYTTSMVKGVTAAFANAGLDRSVVAVVFTGAGDRAFCTGGNVKEYSEYYARRPAEYGQYMDLFNSMVDSILGCKKPTICRVNGMRVAGGQEIGMACDITVASDLAVFGQAGPKHGSAPDGGSTDFLPWFLTMEDALWNCVSCETWSAYKMLRKGLITKAVPVLRKDGRFLRNPQVMTEDYVVDGEIAYGEMKTGPELEKARDIVKGTPIDFERLDQSVADIVWRFANLFPGCLMKSIDGIRAKKKYFWDQMKLPNRHWLAANMSTEAFLGFGAFNTKKLTGSDVIDFIKYRQLAAQGRPLDESFFDEVLAKPLEKAPV